MMKKHQRLIQPVAPIHPPNHQLHIRRPQPGGERDPVPHLPPKPRHPYAPDNTRVFLLNERLLLPRIHDRFREDAKNPIRIARELREVALRLINVDPAQPRELRHVLHPGHPLNPVLILLRQHIRQRHPVPRHNPQTRLIRRRRLRHQLQRRQQNRQQKQTDRHAQHRQNQPPLVAERVAQDEAGDGHGGAVSFQRSAFSFRIRAESIRFTSLTSADKRSATSAVKKPKSRASKT